MTHRGPFQPQTFCDSLILRAQHSEETGDKKGLGSVYGVRQMCLASEVHLCGDTGFRRRKAEMVLSLEKAKMEKAKGNQVISQKTSSG